MEISKERQIEILNKIIHYLEHDTNLNTGICGVLTKLYKFESVSKLELTLTQNLIYDNKPTKDNQYKEFTQNEIWNNPIINFDYLAYWWLPVTYKDNKAREVRIQFLNAVINNIK